MSFTTRYAECVSPCGEHSVRACRKLHQNTLLFSGVPHFRPRVNIASRGDFFRNSCTFGSCHAQIFFFSMVDFQLGALRDGQFPQDPKKRIFQQKKSHHSVEVAIWPVPLNFLRFPAFSSPGQYCTNSMIFFFWNFLHIWKV